MHGRQVCVCGIVLSQCRCMGHDRDNIISPCTHEKSNDSNGLPPLPGQLDIEKEVKKLKNRCHRMGCKNKAIRTGKRQYADYCHSHVPMLGAA